MTGTSTEFARHRVEWKRQPRGVETATVATALEKADVHLARVALVLAEAEQPGSFGLARAEIVKRAALIVNFTVDCWRALPANGGLALTRRDEKLDSAVEKVRDWIEQRGGEAQQARYPACARRRRSDLGIAGRAP